MFWRAQTTAAPSAPSASTTLAPALAPAVPFDNTSPASRIKPSNRSDAIVPPSALPLPLPLDAAPSSATLPVRPWDWQLLFQDPGSLSEADRRHQDVMSHRMNRWILGSASAVAVFMFAYTVRRQTRSIKGPKVKEFFDDPVNAANNPKLAAYMFVGKAFMTATALVGLGATAIGFGISSAADVHSLKEFSQKMQVWGKQLVPQPTPRQTTEELDAMDREFFEALDRDLASDTHTPTDLQRRIKSIIHSELTHRSRESS